MQVFDNVITLGEANEIQKAINNSDFPFYIGAGGLQFGTGTVGYDIFEEHGYDPNVKDHFHFVHSVIGWEVETNKSVVNSTADELCVNLMNKFMKHIGENSYEIYRAKINLSPQHKRPEGTYCVPHTDIEREHMVVIYYVNDSDGPTYLFEEDGRTIIKKVDPKKGRFLMFDGRTKHAGSHPIDNTYRIVINYNIKINNDR